MQSLVIKFLTVFAISAMAYGVGYYYIAENAPICANYVDEAFVVNRSCVCKGYEYERKSLDEDGGGRRESVCIGKIESVSCEKRQINDTYEVECPGADSEDLLEE